jgi:hypothetical protein
VIRSRLRLGRDVLGSCTPWAQLWQAWPATTLRYVQARGVEGALEPPHRLQAMQPFRDPNVKFRTYRPFAPASFANSSAKTISLSAAVSSGVVMSPAGTGTCLST